MDKALQFLSTSMVDLQSPYNVIYDSIENTAVIVRDNTIILLEGPFRGLSEAAHAVDRYLAGLDVANVTLMPNLPELALPGFDMQRRPLS